MRSAVGQSPSLNASAPRASSAPTLRGLFDRARGRRRARPRSSLPSSSASRATSSHACARSCGGAGAGSRARVVSSVSAARSPAPRCTVASTRNAAGMTGLGAPQLVREVERGLAIAGGLGACRAARRARRARGCASRARGCARPLDSSAMRSAGARAARGFVEQLRGIGVAADRFVAARERRLRGGNRRIERERLLVVDLRLRRIVELLLEDQRELEVERAAIARRRARRRSRDRAATRRAPTRRAPSPRCAADTRSPDRPARTRALP